VRLEVPEHLSRSVLPGLFQFQPGAIRGWVSADTGAAAVASFQFQPGAIRGLWIRRRCVGGSVFQFQPGAIRGLNVNVVTAAASKRFNSSLVRLEARNRDGSTRAFRGFQFQPGAIRGVMLFNTCYRHTMFQFQPGAIRGRGWPPYARPIKSFNSSLVRLEAPCRSSQSRRLDRVSIPAWCD